MRDAIIIVWKKGVEMPGLGFIALLDDIGSMMEKVAAMAKANMGAAASVADKTGQALGKSAGVVGDDIALGTEVLRVGEMERRVGLMAKRELGIVWEVAKGSAVNKVWISGLALGLSASMPWALHGLLAVGGAYLCMEGAQKVASALGWGHGGGGGEPVDQGADRVLEGKELARFERDKIKGAVRTDMVLSGEIILITLGALSALPLWGQALGLAGVGVAMTVGVYASVAALVKLDDVGLWMIQKGSVARSAWMVWTGGRLMICMPAVMKSLTVVGVGAMLAVGGGILCHAVPVASGLLERAGHVAYVGPVAEALAAAAVGLAAGLGLEFLSGIAPVAGAMRFILKRMSKVAGHVEKMIKKARKAHAVQKGASTPGTAITDPESERPEPAKPRGGPTD